MLGAYPGDPGPLGGECAGLVVAVGEGVDELRVGDAVVAVAAGSFRTHVTCPASLVAPKPPDWTFAQAAGLLIANVTAQFALSEVGRLQRGERVLIHAAAGGVGLAAVGLALRSGAEVFATAGSEEKRAFLVSMGVRFVYDSRSLDFADLVMADTGGEGVDVVLNSLAGDFVSRSFALLRDGGRFLEIGKRDHLAPDAIAGLGRGRQYHVIDWGETARQDPDVIRAIVRRVVAGASSAALVPLPMRTFPFADGQAAFRYMAQARHIGKVVVTQADAVGDRSAPGIRDDATYLITGGMRGLGLLTACHLADLGARHLVLMGRRPPTDAARAQLAELEANGVQVTLVEGDVSRRADVDRTFAMIAATMPPLRGIFHSAGALDDGAVSQLTWDRFRRVLAAKVAGASHLDALSASLELDHFVLYSSIASLVGSPGQSNHAAANAFLDALAHRRAVQGRPALSINWGAWSEIGAAADLGVDQRVGEVGVGVIPPAGGLERLDRLMAAGAPQVGVTPMDWPTLFRRYGETGPPPYLGTVTPSHRPDAEHQRPAPQADLVAELGRATPRRRAGILLEFVREQSARILALPSKQVGDRTPLSEMGLDSLMAVELRNLLGASLGAGPALPATLVFDYPTIEAIAGYLGREVLAFDDDGDEPVEPELAPTRAVNGTLVSSLMDDLENLSDDHIDRLFEEKARS